MTLRLAANWKTLLRRAWSVRWMILAAFFELVGAFLPYADVSPTLAHVLALFCIVGALVSRLLAQPEITHAR